jgi:type II secretory pathway pseudopilin PulG
MVRSNRGFTVVSLVVVMTISGLLLIGVFIMVAQRSWRDDQRRRDLNAIDAMIEHDAANNLGKYPSTQDANNGVSKLRMEFDGMHMIDPKAGTFYAMGSDFGPCDTSAPITDRGVGYISYARPGVGGSPFKLRICLEWGEFSLGQ